MKALLALHVAWRFLLENRRSMGLSGLGVVFGTAFFICGQAQTEGFQRFYIQTILGTSGSIVLSDRIERTFSAKGEGLQMRKAQSVKYYPGVPDAYKVIDVLYDYPQVLAAAPVVEGNSFMAYAFRSETVRIFGIDLALHLQATNLGTHLIKGSLEEFRMEPAAVLVGSELAEKLEVGVGDSVHLAGKQGERRRFIIAGVFETGINVIDANRVYIHRLAAQSLLDMLFDTSHIIIRLRDPNRAPAVAEAMEEHFSHRSRSWQEREKGNLAIFQTLRLSAGLAVTAIILLSGFSIFNVLTMSVLEKTKEIAILRSMGFQRGDISAVFVWQGMLVAFAGTVLGWALGALMTWGVSMVPIKIRGVLKADTFIVEWSLDHYLAAAGLCLITVLVASWLPARRAARLRPVETLRGTGH